MAWNATIIDLNNTGSQPILIDSVTLVDASKKVAPVDLISAEIADPGVTLQVTPAKHPLPFPAAAGYCLPPSGNTDHKFLALRLTPAFDRDQPGQRTARNNAVNVHYRTLDGQRYVAGYGIQFSFPLQPPHRHGR